MPSPLSHQSHKARMRYIESLRVVYGKGRKRKSPVKLPSLKVEERTAPLSNNIYVKFSSELKTGGVHKDAKQFPVGHSHKQGMTLITDGMVKNGELQYMGGKKS